MILGLGGAVPNIDLQSIVDGENNLKVLIPTSKFESLILSLLMDITLTLLFFLCLLFQSIVGFSSVDFSFITEDYVTSMEESLSLKLEDSISLKSDNKCAVVAPHNDKFSSARMFTEDEARVAYSAVFERILTAEGGSHGDQSWKPKYTGLHLVDAPKGKGGSRWVSAAGIEEFKKYGNDAIKNIGRN